MPKRVTGLTKRQAETAGPGFHACGGGLYLSVRDGARSWVLRYMRAGRRHDMGLGSADLIPMDAAKEAAREARLVLAGGHDPIEARREARAAQLAAEAKRKTFAVAAAEYLAAHRAGWKTGTRHEKQWERSLELYAYPVLGRLDVADIDRAAVLRAIDPIWRTKGETADRVRNRIELILDRATSLGYRQGDNPARWKGGLEHSLPKREKVRRRVHHAALPYDQVGAFLGELRERDGIVSRAFQFAILTATRTSEVIGARWDEFDLKAKTWTIPAARMKAAKEHRVPLSDAALEIVDAMAAVRCDQFVFPGRGTGGLSNMAFLAMLKRMGRGDLTTHGFRSSFRDWCAEQTNFPREVAEQALAHSIGDAVEAAYRRGDLYQKRRQLMTAWARFCSTPSVTPGATVVTIRG